jgi:DNA gyrase subunit A
MGRNTQGVRVINLKDGDSIADVTRVIPEEAEEPEENEDQAAEEEQDATDEAAVRTNGQAD